LDTKTVFHDLNLRSNGFTVIFEIITFDIVNMISVYIEEVK